MGWGTGNIGGGSGGGLNFKVVGNPQPETPKENTIWVATDVDITSWIFSATEPEPPADGKDGLVWFKTGTSSSVEFNALKKNSIQVFPISAMQYVSGAWTDKTAKICQGGSWVDWSVYLYNNGTFSPPLTSEVTKTLATTTVEFSDNKIRYFDTNVSGYTGGFAFDNKINVSDFKIVRAKCRATSPITDTQKYKCGISKAKSTSAENMVSISYIPYSNDAEYVDVKVDTYSGEFYLVFACAGTKSASGRVEIEEIMLV